MKIANIFLGTLLLLGTAAGAGPNEATVEMDTSMKKMMSDMKAMKMSGHTDHDFAMMMRPHHQGAIDMAKVELKYGSDPKLKKMAQNIVNGQTKEIGELDGWLKAHPMPKMKDMKMK